MSSLRGCLQSALLRTCTQWKYTSESRRLNRKRDLYARLDHGGAVLIADLVAPRSERSLACVARWWDAEVKRQSLALIGSLEVYHTFDTGHDNWYAYLDPIDMPSTIPQHLDWLEDVGFLGADIVRLRSSHAVYGGYKAGPG